MGLAEDLAKGFAVVLTVVLPPGQTCRALTRRMHAQRHRRHLLQALRPATRRSGTRQSPRPVRHRPSPAPRGASDAQSAEYPGSVRQTPAGTHAQAQTGCHRGSGRRDCRLSGWPPYRSRLQPTGPDMEPEDCSREPAPGARSPRICAAPQKHKVLVNWDIRSLVRTWETSHHLYDQGGNILIEGYFFPELTEPTRAGGWALATGRRRERASAFGAPRGADRGQFNAASVIAWVQAPSGVLVITGSDPPVSRVSTVRW